MLPNCFPRKKGTTVLHVQLKIIMKVSEGVKLLQLSIQKVLNFINWAIFLWYFTIITYIYVVLFSLPFNFEFQKKMNLLSICCCNFKKIFVKRGCKQCLFYEPKKNAHLAAPAAFHGPPFSYDKWFRSETVLCSNLRQKCEGKSWLISKEIVCSF